MMMSELPEPEVHDAAGYRRAFTADQMRAFARQAVAAAMERAAQIADKLDCAHRCGVGSEVAAAIRGAAECAKLGQHLPLTKLDKLARVYCSSYASPHHMTFTVEGLRNLIGVVIQGDWE
jgi:hypothetical protein